MRVNSRIIYGFYLSTVIGLLLVLIGVNSAPAITSSDDTAAATTSGNNSKVETAASKYVDPYAKEPPYAYDFGYSIHADDGSSSYQREVGDHAGRKTGSYSYQGPDGIYRTVTYVADEKGFRATIHTNEPGTKDQEGGPVKVSTSRKNRTFTRVKAAATHVRRRQHTKFEVAQKGLPKQKLVDLNQFRN